MGAMYMCECSCVCSVHVNVHMCMWRPEELFISIFETVSVTGLELNNWLQEVSHNEVFDFASLCCDCKIESSHWIFIYEF